MITTDSLTIMPSTTPDTLWTYTVAATGETFTFAPPVFELDGQPFIASVDRLEEVAGSQRTLPNGAAEYVARGACTSDPEPVPDSDMAVGPGQPRRPLPLPSGRWAGTEARRLTKAGGVDQPDVPSDFVCRSSVCQRSAAG